MNSTLLYCFIIFDHYRRKVIQFDVTSNPNSIWVQHQIKQAFPWDEHDKKYFIHDNDQIFSKEVKDLIKSMGFSDKPTSYRSPWQNPYCERMIGSIKRYLIDHVIVINKYHLKNMLTEYLKYYHQDRTHLGLDKDAPDGRYKNTVGHKPANIISLPRVGGLHHRYEHADQKVA